MFTEMKPKINEIFNIYSASHMNGSLKKENDSAFSFLRFCDLSVGEFQFSIFSNLVEQYLMTVHKRKREIRLKDSPSSLFNIFEPLSKSIDPVDKFYESKPLLKAISIKSLQKVTCPPIELYSPGSRSDFVHSHQMKNDAWTKNIFNGFSCTSPKPFVTVSQTTGTVIPHSDDSVLNDYEGLFTPYYDIFSSNLISLPRMSKKISDSGKLKILEKLLDDLKKEGHRVLIFSQMTKMLNILEDLMIYKNYQYFRLDGSTNISDRNEMVTSFQTRDDIFVFLLSTRAGGLGITLTAADTVIFYDNDWNPTSDQQAMDRCHRIGQTKPVTVYRLVTKGTIEERILSIANQKSIIQETVYNGSMEPVTNSKEIMSLLLDDQEKQVIQQIVPIVSKPSKSSGLIDDLMKEVNEEIKSKKKK
jgi:SNF2 family DNA or RNA helicase